MLEINPDEDIAPQYIEAVVGQKVEKCEGPNYTSLSFHIGEQWDLHMLLCRFHCICRTQSIL